MGAEAQSLADQLKEIDQDMNAGQAEKPASPAAASEEKAPSDPDAEGEGGSRKKDKNQKGQKKKKAAKGKKNTSKPEVPWTAIVGARLRAARDLFADLGWSLISRDGPTRRMALLFFISCLGLAGVIGSALYRTVHLYHVEGTVGKSAQSDQAKNLNRFFERQQEVAFHRGSTINVGKFKVKLRENPDQPKVPGVVNMAEIEITLQCDQKATCNYMERNAERVRDQLTQVLFTLDRHELMSPEGKKRIKKRVIRKINLWLPLGRVKKMYFTHLIVG